MMLWGVTPARLVALVNDTEGVVERAATRLVELAGDMSLEKVYHQGYLLQSGLLRSISCNVELFIF